MNASPYPYNTRLNPTLRQAPRQPRLSAVVPLTPTWTVEGRTAILRELDAVKAILETTTQPEPTPRPRFNPLRVLKLAKGF